MSNKRGQAGRIGISGNASVSMEKIAGENAGEPVPLPADENDNLLLAKMVGEDDNGDFQRVATDQNGRIKVKDVQFDGTVDIGDLQVMNKSEEKINPATEGTVSTLLTESTFTATDFFTPGDFTESRNVRELQNESSVTSGTDSGGGSLPSNAVPDGRTVRVQALQGNGATIQVDGNFELVPGQAIDLAVDNTDKISYTASAGDGVCFIVES